MKSIKYIILVIGILGVVASIFNMVHDWSLSGIGTLFSSAALIGVAFVVDKKMCETQESGNSTS